MPPRRHREAPVAEVLVELLAPPPGAALLGQLVAALALLAIAPVEQDADLLGAPHAMTGYVRDPDGKARDPNRWRAFR